MAHGMTWMFRTWSSTCDVLMVMTILLNLVADTLSSLFHVSCWSLACLCFLLTLTYQHLQQSPLEMAWTSGTGVQKCMSVCCCLIFKFIHSIHVGKLQKFNLKKLSWGDPVGTISTYLKSIWQRERSRPRRMTQVLHILHKNLCGVKFISSTINEVYTRAGWDASRLKPLTDCQVHEPLTAVALFWDLWTVFCIIWHPQHSGVFSTIANCHAQIQRDHKTCSTY